MLILKSFYFLFQILNKFDYFFTTVFTIEILIKVSIVGLPSVACDSLNIKLLDI